LLFLEAKKKRLTLSTEGAYTKVSWLMGRLY